MTLLLNTSKTLASSYYSSFGAKRIPEVLLRSMLHKQGFRFRIHVKQLPGKPDILFPSRRKAIFVHGCFWHWHSDPKCVEGRIPSSKQDYWVPKLRGNRERDKRHLKSLKKEGWKVLVVWECEFKDLERLVKRVKRFLLDPL